MSEARRKLLEIAQQYTSEVEFKEQNLPKYLLAKKKRVLPIAFPPEDTIDHRPGIYYLYKDQRVMFIGMSEGDAYRTMQDYLERTNLNVNNYKIFHPSSMANLRVLYHYLVAKYKPRYNTDVVSDLLTIHIVESTELLGKPDKGTLP